METIISKDKSRITELNPEDLIPNVIELDYFSEDQPLLQFWLLLNKKPEPGTLSLDNMLEKGILNMHLKINNPSILLKEKKNPDVLLKKITLQLFDKKNNIVISEITGYSTSATYRFETVLDSKQCFGVQAALKNSISPIHIRAEIFFQDGNIESGIKLMVPLRKILGSTFFSLSDKVRNNCFRVRYFDAVTVNYIDAPVFTFSRSQRSGRMGMVKNKMIKQDTAFVQPLEFIKPGKPSEISLATQPEASFHASNKLWYLNDIRIKNDAAAHAISLPVITDQDLVLWRDSADSNKFWYMPEYRLRIPEQNVSTSSSPFLLTFRKKGSDINGQPVLEGEIRVTLTSDIPDAAKYKQKELPGIILIPLTIQMRTYVLEIPFMDPDGTAKTSTVSPSEVSVTNNQIQLQFNLTNTWLRACYGVMSIEAFQSTKARIKIFSSFSGMVKVQKGEINLLATATLLKLPLIKNNLAISTAAFNIEKREVVINDESVNFRDVPKNRAPGPGKIMLKNNTAMSTKIGIANTIMVKPGQELPSKVESGEQLVERTFAKDTNLEVFFPCNIFGQSYVEEDSNGTLQAVGCKEPYRLGEIKFNLYDALNNFSSPFCQVYRSLQSPDHFLILPRRYRVTRFDESNPETAFRPCMHLYGAIDETLNFQNSLCVLDMSLDPDIPIHEYRQLLKKLEQYCNQKPIIEFPGEVMQEVKFSWSLPSGMQINTLSRGRTIQMTVTLDIMEVLTLQTMIKKGSLNGQAVYILPDKSQYTVSLNPDTANITGPWETGPFQITKEPGKINFTNKTEKTIQLYKAFQKISDTADEVSYIINKSMLPGSNISIEVTSTEGIFVPECLVEPKESDLDQDWVFVDDISCQVIFTTDIDFIQNKISGIDIELRFSDGPAGIQSTRLTSADPVKEFETIIPVTKISGKRTISYKLRKIEENVSNDFSEWIQWDIKDQGNIINVTSNQLFHT